MYKGACPSFETLRNSFEKVMSGINGGQLPPVAQDHLSLIHEMEVQRIELELQNQELRRANRALVDSRREIDDVRDPRQTNEPLKQGENLYRELAANLPNGAAFIVDRKLTYVLAEGRALELVGLKPGELEGKTLHEALDPQLTALYEPHYRSALNGKTSKIEHHGHDRYFLTHFRPLRDNDGTVYAALAVSYDITDRGQAEKALHRSEQNLADELSTAHLLHKVSTQLLQANGVQALYAKILNTAVDLMHADFGSIQVFYPDRGKEGELRLIGYRGFNEPSARFWEWVRPASESTCGVALRTRQRVLVPDVQACGFMAGSEDLKAYLQNGIRAVQTTPLLSRTGTLIGMLSTHWRQPHTPTEGQLRAIDVLARQAADLIDQKKADEALKESEERFRTMADGLPLIVWVHDAEGKQEFVNQTFLDFFGVTHDEMKDDRWQVLMHPEDAPGYADEFLACVRERRFFHRQVRVQNADGEWRWIESWGRPRITSSGKYLGHVGTSADITERKRAEEALQRREEEFRALVENAPDVISLFDRNLRRIYVNAEIRQNTGQDAAFMIGKSLAEVGYPDRFAQPLNAAIQNVFATGREETVELDWEAPKGHIWLQIRCAPIRTADGSVEQVMSIGRDITDHKQAEEALHESVQELNEYTYALTHNIKAPFRAVQNYATFLLEDLADALDDKPKQFLDGIKKAVCLANQQFEDLEALYSVKDRPLEFETFDMRQLLGEIAALHDGMRDRDLVIEAQWPTLWGERFLLRQILMALVNNGLKYNASEIKRVEVTWRHGADRRFEIIVRDNGIGIDPRYHEQIFRIFQRLHTEQEYEGTGIGLAVVRKAVKRLDGKVRIESTAGKGSTFVISLPATMAEAASGHDP